MIQLDIVSDPICPWCYIGKAQLDRALTLRPTHPFVIEWHPFQLNPHMPADGIDRSGYYKAKFGGQEAADRVTAEIMAGAASAGLEFDLSAIPRVPNTINAHRLILWSGLEGAQTRVVDALFQAYFQDLRDIGDIEVLADIADSAGLDAAMMHQLLNSDADADLIRDRDTAFREMGITGVPTFLVNRQQAVVGVQPSELWMQVIDEVSGQS